MADGRRLVVVRHAKSEYPLGVPDHDRPLNPRGRRDAPLIGAWLEEHLDWSADAAPTVLVSTATRAQQTWQLARTGLGGRWDAVAQRDEPRIYEAPTQTLLDIVGALPDDCRTAILVGHNPGLVGLIGFACVRDAAYLTAVEKFPTSAVAVLRTDLDWRQAVAGDGGFRVAEFAIPRG